MDVSKSDSEIAYLAASYLIEGAADTFHEAKNKAGEALGSTGKAQLPSNVLVQQMLARNLALFEGPKWSERVCKMRGAALQAMQFFADFEPYLVGSVLYGTATEFSVINIHVYSDALEPIVWKLGDANIHYRLGETPLKTQGNKSAAFACLEITMSAYEFDIVVLPLTYQFNPPLSPLDGKPHQRADMARVEQLISENQTLFGKHLQSISVEVGP